MMYGWIIGLFLLVVLIVVLTRGDLFDRSRLGGGRTELNAGQPAKDILKFRYAKGAIDRSEYEENRAELERTD